MDASRAGLRLLEWGIPLTDLLDLARRHNEATEATARQAVELFARHVRDPLRTGARPDGRTVDRPGTAGDPVRATPVDGLLQAYAELLPAVNTLVGHHFTRTLVRVALDHVEREGPTRSARRSGTGSGPTTARRRAGRRRREHGPVTGRAAADPGVTPPGITLEAAARAREADLPTGPRRPTLVRSMFDAIAPRYDLVNRTMTFGLDVRWRQAVAAGPRAARRVHRARPGLRHGRLPRAPRPRRLPAVRDGPVVGDAGRQPHRAARWPRPTVPPCRWPTAAVDGVTCGYALRNFTDLAGVFAEFGRDRPTRWPHQPARGVRARRRPAPRSATASGSARWCPLIGGLLSDRVGLPVPAPVDRLPARHRRAADAC